MSEKPLHVQVAEALGCKPKQSWGSDWDCTCKVERDAARPYSSDRPHSEHLVHAARCHDGEGLGCDSWSLARYDTDWSATGPLIKRFNIGLQAPEQPACGVGSDLWGAYDLGTDVTWHDADPLVAICKLILGLKAAGKLATSEGGYP